MLYNKTLEYEQNLQLMLYYQERLYKVNIKIHRLRETRNRLYNEYQNHLKHYERVCNE